MEDPRKIVLCDSNIVIIDTQKKNKYFTEFYILSQWFLFTNKSTTYYPSEKRRTAIRTSPDADDVSD